MYERLLDKEHKPDMAEFVAYCGECKDLFEKLNAFLTEEIGAEQMLRFPYGKGYGWA